MKLLAELENTVERFKEIRELHDIPQYAKDLKADGGYKDFNMRLRWDIGRAAIGTRGICDLYNRYDCSDTHIDTLFRKAMLAVFPQLVERCACEVL